MCTSVPLHPGLRRSNRTAFGCFFLGITFVSLIYPPDQLADASQFFSGKGNTLETHRVRLIIPKYRGWQNQIFEIPLRDCIFKARVFSSFFKPYFCKGLLSQPNPIFVPQNKAKKFFIQDRIDAKLKMKVSLIALEVLNCQLFHFESRQSEFPSPR